MCKTQKTRWEKKTTIEPRENRESCGQANGVQFTARLRSEGCAPHHSTAAPEDGSRETGARLGGQAPFPSGRSQPKTSRARRIETQLPMKLLREMTPKERSSLDGG